MLIYLAASLDPRIYKETHQLLRLLSDALRRRYGYQCVYPHGRTPSEADPANKCQPPQAELASLARRMIEGDGLLHPAPDAVWTVGVPDQSAMDQVEMAERAGLPVGCVGDDEIAELTYSQVPAPPPSSNDGGGVKNARLSATRILHLYLSGGDRLLGCRAASMEPREGGTSSRKSRVDDNASTMAYAAAIMRAAMMDKDWTPEMLPLLVLVERDGQTLAHAAEMLGIRRRSRRAGMSAAARLRDKSLGIIGRVLFSKEKESEIR